MNNIMDYISLVRGKEKSSKLISYIFTHGNCYQFYLLLKYVFPEAKPYKVDYKRDGIDKFIISHVVTKIGSKYYDINGQFLLCESNYTDIKPMNKKDIKIAEQFGYGLYV